MIDGLFSIGPQIAPPTGFVGILYAEDFDEPAPTENPLPPENPAPPALTQADLEAACAEAVRAAQAEWQASAAQAHRAAVANMAAALAEIGQTAERATLAAAEGTVSTVLSMVNGLLPAFCREHGPAEVRALLGRLLPTIRSRERIAVRVHPDLVAPLRRDVEALDGNLSGLIDVLPASLEPGDVKVTWENGALTRNTKQMLQAVTDALSQLGLCPPTETPAKRSMAYAD